MIESRMVRLVGHVARMAEKRNEYRKFVDKTEGERELGMLNNNEQNRISWYGLD
jgi:hypothetical protein